MRPTRWWDRGKARSLRSDFCVRSVRACSKEQLELIDKARNPEPEMPLGMLPEDWPKYKDEITKQMKEERRRKKPRRAKKATQKAEL